ncbi:hypothetical protein JAAARDRAFT_198247 [Jaapia argillacea MUCL 33604]|uniref:Uncharacterized protein n=1 Tax=Jaapia argillacea MUCL 33604 TaxID=933084 RepID=A0A067PCI0_9AGAM|nr:hypothetical protein JAAARDRAFT_198247 [Jaapia argillacea MUCL 33604]
MAPSQQPHLPAGSNLTIAISPHNLQALALTCTHTLACTITLPGALTNTNAILTRTHTLARTLVPLPTPMPTRSLQVDSATLQEYPHTLTIPGALTIANTIITLTCTLTFANTNGLITS